MESRQHIYEGLRVLSDKLQLSFETQDWGIVNANSARVDEFIQFFMLNELADPLRYQMFELIVASYNEALVEGRTNAESDQNFEAFVKEISVEQIFVPIVNYWKSIKGEEFPVGRML